MHILNFVVVLSSSVAAEWVIFQAWKTTCYGFGVSEKASRIFSSLENMDFNFFWALEKVVKVF